MKLHGINYTPESFDMLVLDAIEFGKTMNAYCVAYELKATRSRATRQNIAASLDRLHAEGYLEREDLAVQDLEGNPLASPLYRRVR